MVFGGGLTGCAVLTLGPTVGSLDMVGLGLNRVITLLGRRNRDPANAPHVRSWTSVYFALCFGRYEPDYARNGHGWVPVHVHGTGYRCRACACPKHRVQGW